LLGAIIKFDLCIEVCYNKEKEVLRMEEWRQVSDFPDYEVSNLGRVKSHKRRAPIILKNNYYSNGYVFVLLFNGEKRKSCSVHRLVLENFCPCDNMEQLQVNHINCIRDDNRLENLEWTTRQENAKYRDNLKHTPKAQTIRVVFLDDREDMYFNSKMACAKYFGVSRKTIDKYLETQNIRSDRKVQAHFYLVGNTYELNKEVPL
jgi:hypothetical protein